MNFLDDVIFPMLLYSFGGLNLILYGALKAEQNPFSLIPFTIIILILANWSWKFAKGEQHE